MWDQKPQNLNSDTPKAYLRCLFKQYAREDRLDMNGCGQAHGQALPGPWESGGEGLTCSCNQTDTHVSKTGQKKVQVHTFNVQASGSLEQAGPM